MNHRLSHARINSTNLSLTKKKKKYTPRTQSQSLYGLCHQSQALAFVGFLTAMLVVYAVAQEVMAVLECVGFASGISDAMLGITLLAWGNSVGGKYFSVTRTYAGGGGSVN